MVHFPLCPRSFSWYEAFGQGILDPLVRLKDAHAKKIIPDDVYDLTVKRFPITVAGINRIEKASGINFFGACFFQTY